MKGRKRLLLFVSLLLLNFYGMAQNKTVSGTVIDGRDSTPIIGASVQARGTTLGTTTGANGTFSFSVPQSVTVLTISAVGYATLEVTAGSNVQVTLTAAAGSLGDVVVVGYGTARRKDLTGSVATIGEKDFQKGNITSPEQMLAGKVPGVSIISNSGQPGAGSQIRIRGGSSLNASNSPLIVVDGVPLSGDAVNGSPDPLSLINSDDVESFTVLKDASAAAIYGTRAANGVIIITTKKGKSGALKVNFSSINSMSVISKKVDVLSADELRAVVQASRRADRIAQLGNANTDWQDVIYQHALATTNNINLSGGIKGLPYRLSIGYQNMNGVLRTDNLQRTSIALNVSPVLLNNHLKIDINLKGTRQQVRYANKDAIGAAVSFDPTQPVYSGNNRYGGYYQWLDAGTVNGLNLNAARNPLGLLEQKHDEWTPYRSIGNIQFDYKFHFLPDLRANLNLGYDAVRSTGGVRTDDSSATAMGDYTVSTPYKRGSVTRGKQTVLNTVADFYLNYVKDLREINSRIDVTAGYSYNFFNNKAYNYYSYYGNGDSLVNGTQPILYPYGQEEHSLISYFGRLNYAFNGRYLLTATVRRDASSRFSKSNQWGTFPSVALAWRMKDEKFLQSSKVVSDLKLRVGYGVTGQQDGIGNYLTKQVYTLSNSPIMYYGGVPSLYYSPSGFNNNLKWEQTATYNAALDFGFLRNRITGSVDFYYKKTTDLLNAVPIAAGTSLWLYSLANVGSMENKGVEVNINAQPVRTQNFSWDVNFNITYNKNKILNLTVVPDDPAYLGLPNNNNKPSASNGFALLNAVGGPRNTFYLYQQVYDASGKPIEGLFEDRNRDGIINDQDRYKSKFTDPSVFAGFTSNFTYKKWNLGFVMRGNFNNYLFNDNKASRGRLSDAVGGYTVSNVYRDYLFTGITGNAVNKDQLPLSDYYLENASFVRMDNVNLGYNFGKVFRSSGNLRASFFVQNVFTITKYSGLDPESTTGIDNNIYPRPRIYSVGLNLDL
jgi:TonB-linked SusC/RagA family outer membrane protein